jgi:hypothetical protein
VAADYLDWLTDVFDEAQVPYNDETADQLDRALHTIAGVSYPQESEDEVLRVLRERYLVLGPPGRQLLAAYLRSAFFSDRDSPARPGPGVGYFTNEEYQ